MQSGYCDKVATSLDEALVLIEQARAVYRDPAFDPSKAAAALLQNARDRSAEARDLEALIAAVPDEAIDLIGVACRPGELAEHVARHTAEYAHLDLTGPAWGLDPDQQQAAALAILDGMRPTLLGALANPL